MKRTYQAPGLIEYGPVNHLTQGSNGPKSDILIIFDLRAPTPSVTTTPADSPGCTNNVPGSSTGCYTPVIRY